MSQADGRFGQPKGDKYGKEESKEESKKESSKEESKKESKEEIREFEVCRRACIKLKDFGKLRENGRCHRRVAPSIFVCVCFFTCNYLAIAYTV